MQLRLGAREERASGRGRCPEMGRRERDPAAPLPYEPAPGARHPRRKRSGRTARGHSTDSRKADSTPGSRTARGTLHSTLQPPPEAAGKPGRRAGRRSAERIGAASAVVYTKTPRATRSPFPRLLEGISSDSKHLRPTGGRRRERRESSSHNCWRRREQLETLSTNWWTTSRATCNALDQLVDDVASDA
jgi:hypothetical protein